MTRASPFRLILAELAMMSLMACAHSTTASGPGGAGKWEAKAQKDGAPAAMIENAKDCDEGESGKGCLQLAIWYGSKGDHASSADAAQKACEHGKSPFQGAACVQVEQSRRMATQPQPASSDLSTGQAQ